MEIHYINTIEQLKAVISNGKMGFSIDGHFWLEDTDGNIIEPTPFENKMPFNSQHKYYKKATPFIQKMVIEMAHRKFEEHYGYTRDSDEWHYKFANHEYKQNACFHNTLGYLHQTNGNYKLVFGYLGVYHHSAGRYPKNSVYWLYGCPRYTTVSEVFRTVERQEDIKDHWTYEKWEERDNKTVVINLFKKKK